MQAHPLDLHPLDLSETSCKYFNLESGDKPYELAKKVTLFLGLGYPIRVVPNQPARSLRDFVRKVRAKKAAAESSKNDETAPEPELHSGCFTRLAFPRAPELKPLELFKAVLGSFHDLSETPGDFDALVNEPLVLKDTDNLKRIKITARISQILGSKVGDDSLNDLLQILDDKDASKAGIYKHLSEILPTFQEYFSCEESSILKVFEAVTQIYYSKSLEDSAKSQIHQSEIIASYLNSAGIIVSEMEILASEKDRKTLFKIALKAYASAVVFAATKSSKGSTYGLIQAVDDLAFSLCASKNEILKSLESADLIPEVLALAETSYLCSRQKRFADWCGILDGLIQKSQPESALKIKCKVIFGLRDVLAFESSGAREDALLRYKAIYNEIHYGNDVEKAMRYFAKLLPESIGLYSVNEFKSRRIECVEFAMGYASLQLSSFRSAHMHFNEALKRYVAFLNNSNLPAFNEFCRGICKAFSILISKADESSSGRADAVTPKKVIIDEWWDTLTFLSDLKQIYKDIGRSDLSSKIFDTEKRVYAFLASSTGAAQELDRLNESFRSSVRGKIA